MSHGGGEGIIRQYPKLRFEMSNPNIHPTIGAPQLSEPAKASMYTKLSEGWIDKAKFTVDGLWTYRNLNRSHRDVSLDTPCQPVTVVLVTVWICVGSFSWCCWGANTLHDTGEKAIIAALGGGYCEEAEIEVVSLQPIPFHVWDLTVWPCRCSWREVSFYLPLSLPRLGR